MAPIQPQGETDDRPIGPNLSGLILLRAEDAVAPSAGAGGVDSARISPPDRRGLDRTLATFVGRPLSRKLISDVEAAIVEHYRRAGRPFVSVSAPPQDVTDGVLQLRVVAFTLGRKTASGASAAVNKSIEGGVRTQPGQFIDAGRLQQDLDWMNRSRFRQVGATFTPGDRLGETDLQLQVHSVKPWEVAAGYEDSGTRSSGEDRWFIGASAGDLLIPGSLIAYQLTASDDFWYAQGRAFGGASDPQYVSHSIVLSAPLAPRQDLTIIANDIQSTTPVLDFTAKARTIELVAIYRTALSNVVALPGDVSVGLEARAQRTSTYFGDIKVLQRAVDVRQMVASWSVSWTGPRYRQTFSVSTHISPGNLAQHNHDPDFAASSNARATSAAYSYSDIDYAGDFTLKAPWRYVTALRLQIADRPLLNTEQLAIGGGGGVRTYVYDDQSFDSGAVWRNELRGPPLRLPQGGILRAIASSPYVFADAAYGLDMNGGPRQFAGSVGLGLDWSLGAHLSGGFAGGWSLKSAAFTREGQFKLLARVRSAF